MLVRLLTMFVVHYFKSGVLVIPLYDGGAISFRIEVKSRQWLIGKELKTLFSSMHWYRIHNQSKLVKSSPLIFHTMLHVRK